MAVTGSIVGRETEAMFAQGSTWGTEVTASNGMLILEDGMEFTQSLDPIEENDSTWLRGMDLGTRTAAFNFKQNLRFDDIRGIAFVLGDGNYASPTEVNAGKGDYQHTIYPDEDNFGDFATIAIKKGSIVQTFPSVKYAGFTMSGTSSPNRVEVSYNTFADTLSNASTVVTASAFGSLSYPAGNGGRAFFRNFNFKINDQSDAALDSGDLISNAITSFEWSIQRQLASDYTNDSGLSIDEPVEDGYMESTLTINLRNLDTNTDTYFTNLVANTAKKLEFVITGAAASSATGTVAPASITVQAPNAIVENVDYGPYSGPGRIPSSVTFKLLGADTTSDAAGMAFVEPFKLVAVNSQSTKQVS